MSSSKKSFFYYPSSNGGSYEKKSAIQSQHANIVQAYRVSQGENVAEKPSIAKKTAGPNKDKTLEDYSKSFMIEAKVIQIGKGTTGSVEKMKRSK